MANFTLLQNASFVTTGTAYLNDAASPLDTFTINASANGPLNAVVTIEQSSDGVTFNNLTTWTIGTSVYFSDIYTVDVPLNAYIRANVVSISGLNAQVSVLFSASTSSSTALLNSNQTSSGATNAVGADSAGNLYDSDGNLVNGGTGLPSYIGSVAATNGLPDFLFGALRNIRSQIPRRFDVRGNTVRLAYAFMQSGSSSEQAIVGSSQLEAFATIRGVSYRATFSGSNTLITPYGKIVISDEITLPFFYNMGEEWQETVQKLDTTTGNQYIVYRDSPQFLGFSGWVSVYKNDANWIPLTVTNGLVETPAVGGSWLTTNDLNYYGAYFGSCAILGNTTRNTYFISGDSRQKLGAAGRVQSCIKDKWGITGEVASWCHANNVPFINCGWSGESYTTALQANQYTERLKLTKFATAVIDCYGINDIGGGSSFSGTCTSTTTTSVTGASVSGATAAVGDFVEGATLWPNTRIESGSGATFTLSRAPISATTSFTLRRANTNTLSAWISFITQFRTLLNWWNKPYFHNTMFPRNAVNLTTAKRTQSNATTTINYFNWLLRTGQLETPVTVNGKQLLLIDGMVDGAVALTETGNTGVYKTPADAFTFTSGDGITTTVGSNLVQSTAGSFKPSMNGHIMYIEGAGGTSASTNVQEFGNATVSTTLRGYIVYLNANWIALTIPTSTQDNTQSRATSIVNDTSTRRTQAVVAVSNANAYINNGDFDIDGLHLGANGEIEVAKNGNFSKLGSL